MIQIIYSSDKFSGTLTVPEKQAVKQAKKHFKKLHEVFRTKIIFKC